MSERCPGYPQQEISFTDRIVVWQNLIDSLPENSLGRERCEQEALTNLNGRWQHGGEDCLLFGTMLVGLIGEGDGKVECVSTALAGGTPAVSDGFGLFTFTEDGTPKRKVVYMFRADSTRPVEITSDDGVVEYVNRARYALNPLDGQILFSSDFEVTMNLRGLMQQLSDELAAYMQSPDFLILHAEEQQTKIEFYVAQAWQQMNVLHPGLKFVECMAERAYVLQPTERPVLQFDSVDISDVLIEGDLVGLEVLETQQLASGEAIRRPSDFVDERAGLCLAIMPSEATANELGSIPGADLIYIPISSQDIEVVFGQESVNARQ